MDGCIDIDSRLGRELGFTSDLFHPMSYLWKTGDQYTISFITSLHEGKGNTRRLLDKLEARAKRIIVPGPSGRMQKICESRGYEWKEVELKDGFTDYMLVWESK